jgi:hypothetical protein
VPPENEEDLLQKPMAVFRCALMCATLGVVQGLFFHIKMGEVKCFVEEVPDETMVSGKWFVRDVVPEGSWKSATS